MYSACFLLYAVEEDFLNLRFFAAGVACIGVLPGVAFADTSGAVNGIVMLGRVPASGVSVAIKGENSSQTVTTDTHGRFRFPRVTLGSYVVIGSRSGLVASAPVFVASGGLVDMILTLHEAQEIGSVSAASGRGPSASPVAVTVLDHAAIAAMPQGQSLDRLIDTVPGIVRFSYDEPVAHGFHGVTYEVDGVPIPQGTAANFSEVIDPRNIDSLEVFTGAIPAEYGGERQGAVVNIVTTRPAVSDGAQSGTLTVGAGSYGDAQTSLADRIAVGSKTQIYFNGNLERTNRGLDSPTFEPVHDHADQSNEFLRSVTDLGHGATLNATYMNNIAKYEIPINTDPNNPNDPVSSPAATDDVQTEHDQLLSVAYTKTAKNGSSYTRIVPWMRTDTVKYLGDVSNDLMSNVNNGDGTFSPLNSLTQNRSSTFEGLRFEHFHVLGEHALKAGLDSSVENFHGTEAIGYFDTANTLQAFSDNAAQRGSNLGGYVQDKWTPTRFMSIFGGVRYDRSTGYTSGAQLSPRLEVNGKVGAKDILHGYYGRQYAAPYLEDTRRAAVVLTGAGPSTVPVYDLKPERDTSVEIGIAHTMSVHARWYLNLWKRDATNVLDTTSLAQTPIQAVFNNTVGVAKGIEARIESTSDRGDSAFLSATISQSLAGGIDGGTFLFCPPPVTSTCAATNSDVSLQPEDHDQTVAINGNYTKRIGLDRTYFVSLAPQYGTGYPVQFQNGSGRLPPHLTFDMALGRDPGKGSAGHLGYQVTLQNLTNRDYLIKVNNGFNTTQYGAGFRADVKITKPF